MHFSLFPQIVRFRRFLSFFSLNVKQTGKSLTSPFFPSFDVDVGVAVAVVAVVVVAVVAVVAVVVVVVAVVLTS